MCVEHGVRLCFLRTELLAHRERLNEHEAEDPLAYPRSIGAAPATHIVGETEPLVIQRMREHATKNERTRSAVAFTDEPDTCATKRWVRIDEREHHVRKVDSVEDRI